MKKNVSALILVSLIFIGCTDTSLEVVDFSIDYLRPGRYKKMYASCTVLRQGRKLINVSSNAWQENKKIPVATARCHFLVP